MEKQIYISVGRRTRDIPVKILPHVLKRGLSMY